MISIICPKHGLFEQQAGSHLRGSGCPCCGDARSAFRRASNSAKSFISQAQAVHGVGTYDYSRATYINNSKKVTIICPKHGAFEQQPQNHILSRNGCPACARALWADRTSGREATLYFVEFSNESERFFKVGITSHDVATRYNTPSSRGGYNITVLAVHKSSNAVAVFEWEQSIIETFAHLSYKPKRHLPGATECFSSADEILSIFPL